MEVLFCHIGWMKEYRGIIDKDHCITGSAYLDIDQENGEQYNFLQKEEYYYGYVATKSMKKNTNEIFIEKLQGTKETKDVDNIVVIWVATEPSNKHGIKMVGWYKNATVYRTFQKEAGTIFNIKARVEDCTLLPLNQRKFFIDIKSEIEGRTSNVWYPEQIKGESLLKNILNYICNYEGSKLNKGIVMEDLKKTAIENLPTVENYVERGGDLYEEGEEVEALKYFNKALELGYIKAEVYNAKGLILYHLYQYKEALKQYEIAESLKSDFSEVVYNKALIYYELKIFTTALELFNKFLEQKPNDIDGLIYKMLVLKELDLKEEACRILNTALRLDPINTFLQNMRIELLE